ncbi:MAG: thymidine phosphorylase [Armatimonadetes bacterium]|nr:thymidine phosphorylase [Armatimonadota bacterium]
MNFLSLLESKRDGAVLSEAQLQSIIAATVAGEIPDYQLSAFLMAIYFRGLIPQETRTLTLAMRDSGEVLSFPDDGRPVVDKHSTGGVGDKVSLPLAPLLACLGFRVPMISGRGLGITGGTLDKLESIPGFRTNHSRENIVEIVQNVGCCIVAQSEKMVPADKKLYALRDVTATVPSIPLITASILSKKLAEGLDALVLDVKWGRAAFMQRKNDARELLKVIVGLGNACGTPTQAFLSDMNSPLGRTAGNWLEVVETISLLETRRIEDIPTGQDQDLCFNVIECAARLLVMTKKVVDLSDAKNKATEVLFSGAPRQKWNEMLVAQGADLAAFEAKLRAPSPVYETEICAEQSGVVRDVDARIIGEIVRDLGGGRLEANSILNLEVGFLQMKKWGEPIEKGEPLALLRAENEAAANAVLERARAAWEIGTEASGIAPSQEEI